MDCIDTWIDVPVQKFTRLSRLQFNCEPYCVRIRIISWNCVSWRKIFAFQSMHQQFSNATIRTHVSVRNVQMHTHGLWIVWTQWTHSESEWCFWSQYYYSYDQMQSKWKPKNIFFNAFSSVFPLWNDGTSSDSEKIREICQIRQHNGTLNFHRWWIRNAKSKHSMYT